MIFLFLAISCSALISITMRLSTEKVTNNVSMLAMNYLMCLCIAAGGTDVADLFPAHASLPTTLGMGAIHGILYLASFVLFQINVQQNGVVLSATFMKLGLLVPMAASILLFGETPAPPQVLGFFIAIVAIILINFDPGQSTMKFRAGLILLLLGGGCGDVMSKVFEYYGDTALSDQFLLYTFLVAFVLCTGLVIWKGEHPGRYEAVFGLLIGIPNFFSAKFLLKALDTVPAVIAYPTYSVATILVVTLIGVLLFKERLGKRQWLGLGIILVAMALLNM